MLIIIFFQFFFQISFSNDQDKQIQLETTVEIIDNRIYQILKIFLPGEKDIQNFQVVLALFKNENYLPNKNKTKDQWGIDCKQLCQFNPEEKQKLNEIYYDAKTSISINNRNLEKNQMSFLWFYLKTAIVWQHKNYGIFYFGPESQFYNFLKEIPNYKNIAFKIKKDIENQNLVQFETFINYKPDRKKLLTTIKLNNKGVNWNIIGKVDFQDISLEKQTICFNFQENFYIAFQNDLNVRICKLALLEACNNKENCVDSVNYDNVSNIKITFQSQEHLYLIQGKQFLIKKETGHICNFGENENKNCQIVLGLGFFDLYNPIFNLKSELPEITFVYEFQKNYSQFLMLILFLFFILIASILLWKIYKKIQKDKKNNLENSLMF